MINNGVSARESKSTPLLCLYVSSPLEHVFPYDHEILFDVIPADAFPSPFSVGVLQPHYPIGGNFRNGRVPGFSDLPPASSQERYRKDRKENCQSKSPDVQYPNPFACTWNILISLAYQSR